MSDIIDLLSSDDEKEERVLPPAAAKKAPPASKKTIDLCSDDDEPKKATSRVSEKQPQTKEQKSQSASFQINSIDLTSSDEDDDNLLNAIPALKAKKDGRNSVQQGPLANNTATSNYAASAAVNNLQRPPQVFLSQDQACQRTTASKNMMTPSLSSAKLSAPKFDTDSDDDDDDILNTPGLFTRKQIHTPAKSIVKNPYAKAASQHCSTTSTPSGVKKPYAKSLVVVSNDSQRQPLTPFPYPKLTENSKQYPDERARFLLAFWKYGRSIGSKSFERLKLDQISKKILKLALSEYPIRSLEEYATGNNSKLSVSHMIKARDGLRVELEKGSFGDLVTPVHLGARSKYHSIVEACLVVLLEHAEQSVSARGNAFSSCLSEKKHWMSLQDMIPEIDERLFNICPGRLMRRGEDDHGAAYYIDPSTRSIEFLQLAKLECKNGDEGPYIKRHSVKGQVQYELLPEGLHVAQRLRKRQFPLPDGHYRSSKIHSLEQVDEKRYDNICLGVDSREGGGGARTLHLMCNKLEMMRCPYFVGHLQIGDYVFFTNNASNSRAGQHMDHLCPIIVERKSIVDVALSIHDGRWEKQKERMYQGQYVFGYENCRMVYIIEGNEDKQAVSGGYIGARWFEVDKGKLQEEISDLKAEGFDVLRTTSVENSMFQLARWVEKISADLKAGKMRAELTYAEFKEKLSKIPKQTDFSRLAKNHTAERKANKDKDAISGGAVYGDDCQPPSLSETNGVAGKSSSTKTLPLSSTEIPVAKKQKLCDAQDDGKYEGWSRKALVEECGKAGLPKSGSIADLVARLKGPRPPPAWIKRKCKGEYVPARYNVGSTALLVALYLHEIEVGEANVGISKDDLYVKTERLEITKNPFSGGTTQTGPYLYDGWTNMPPLLKGDPALVIVKSGKYRLTRSCDIAGFEFAKQLHKWCHEHNNCPCGASTW